MKAEPLRHDVQPAVRRLSEASAAASLDRRIAQPYRRTLSLSMSTPPFTRTLEDTRRGRGSLDGSLIVPAQAFLGGVT
jgi:hypothetical protein